MEALVTTFNNLRRQPLAPSGQVANHWHFMIQCVPLQPPGEVLFLVNPKARYVHIEGPMRLTPPATTAAKAKAIVPLLLKAFTSGMGAPPEIPRLAPWTWATTDSELAREVGKELEAVGVRPELRTVQTGNLEEDMVAQEEWEKFLEQLSGMAGRR